MNQDLNINGNKNDKKGKLDVLKWIGTTMIIPIVIGVSSSYISFKMDKPKEYVFREDPIMDNFKTWDYFPLKKGNSWTYERKIEYMDENNKPAKLQDVVTCKVIDSYGYDDFKLFILKGNPFAEQPSKQDANSIIYGYIVVSNKVIEVPSDKIDDITKKFKNHEGLYYEDLEGLDINFEFPLYDKQRYGEFSQLLRNDGKNIYYVKKLEKRKQKIGENVVEVSEFSINNLYNSGDVEMNFVPFKGITEYNYEHIGTIYKINFRLKEYKLGEE